MAEIAAEIVSSRPQEAKKGWLDRILEFCADYLTRKLDASFKWTPEASREVACSGARLEQELAKLILSYIPGRSSEGKRQETLDRLGFIRGEYQRLILETVRGRGVNIERIPPEAGLSLFEDKLRGVMGVVAVIRMVESLGWQASLPTIEEDVEGIDAFIVIGSGRKIAVQVKCHREEEFSVTGCRLGYREKVKGALVTVPAPRQGGGFFRDWQLAVPHTMEPRLFQEKLEEALSHGKA
jgi:hypothetical protein